MIQLQVPQTTDIPRIASHQPTDDNCYGGDDHLYSNKLSTSTSSITAIERFLKNIPTNKIDSFRDVEQWVYQWYIEQTDEQKITNHLTDIPCIICQSNSEEDRILLSLIFSRFKEIEIYYWDFLEQTTTPYSLKEFIFCVYQYLDCPWICYNSSILFDYYNLFRCLFLNPIHSLLFLKLNLSENFQNF